MKWLPQNWNDTLSLILILIIPLMWGLQGANQLTFPAEVNGGLLVSWSLVLQYYFRRAPTAAASSPETTTTTTTTDTTTTPTDPPK